MNQHQIEEDLLETGMGEHEDTDMNSNKPRCLQIYCGGVEEPYFQYGEFLRVVWKGSKSQTVAFICQPLVGDPVRNYPWETGICLDNQSKSHLKMQLETKRNAGLREA